MSATRAPDFRLSSVFRDHPKIAKLERLLGADGVLAWVQLLAYTSMQRPDGRLTKMDPEDIAIAARWKGDAATFLDALADLKLIDRREKNCGKLHNWSKHNGYAAGFNQRSNHARRAAKARWEKRLDDSDRAMPEQCPSNARAMQHASKSDSPSPSPSPDPKPTPKNGAIDTWFDQEFLAAYPEHHHDQLKTARAYLRKHKPDTAERARILATLELWKASPDWLKDGGKWIKGIGNFFSDGMHLRKPAGVEAGPRYERPSEIMARENGVAADPPDPEAAAKFSKILEGVIS